MLILRESIAYAEGTNAGSYDLPGGRLQPGEKFNQALLREVQEETGLSVTIGHAFHVDEWRPVVKGEEWQVIGVFIECQASSKLVKFSIDHDEACWITPEKHGSFKLIDSVHRAFDAYIAQKAPKSLETSQTVQ